MTSPLRIGTSVTSGKRLKVALLRGLNFIVGSVGCFTILRLSKKYEIEISKFKLNYLLTSRTALPNSLKLPPINAFVPKINMRYEW